MALKSVKPEPPPFQGGPISWGVQWFSFFQHGFDAFSLMSFVGDYFDGQFMVHDFATFASEASDAQGDLVAA